jgi:hypothetical protein
MHHVITSQTIILLVCLTLACDRHSTPATAQSADVPAYLRPAFHSIDSILTGLQRDSLRRLSLDSGFFYRNHKLDEYIKSLEGGWVHSPIGDTVIAHGEKSYVTGYIVLDLYHQYLRHEPLDIAGALRRISPDYVHDIMPHTVSVDSVLLRQDLDGSDVPDQLVREARREPMEVGVENSGSPPQMDTVLVAEYRLALYLNAVPLRAPAAWSATFDDVTDGSLIKRIALAAGGSLLFLDIGGGDGDQTIVLLVRHGTVREILRHQVDYGEGMFVLRDANGRVEVDITGKVRLGDRTVTSDIQCPATEWPGSTLLYDESAQGFVAQRTICVPRQ